MKEHWREYGEYPPGGREGVPVPGLEHRTTGGREYEARGAPSSERLYWTSMKWRVTTTTPSADCSSPV